MKVYYDATRENISVYSQRIDNDDVSNGTIFTMLT